MGHWLWPIHVFIYLLAMREVNVYLILTLFSSCWTSSQITLISVPRLHGSQLTMKLFRMKPWLMLWRRALQNPLVIFVMLPFMLPGNLEESRFAQPNNPTNITNARPKTADSSLHLLKVWPRGLDAQITCHVSHCDVMASENGFAFVFTQFFIFSLLFYKLISNYKKYWSDWNPF